MYLYYLLLLASESDTLDTHSCTEQIARDYAVRRQQLVFNLQTPLPKYDGKQCNVNPDTPYFLLIFLLMRATT